MFYLTTHSTHFILRLYGVRHMVKDHSDSERLAARVFYMHHPTDKIAHTTAFVMEHWLEREIDQWVHNEGSIRRPIRLYFDMSKVCNH